MNTKLIDLFGLEVLIHYEYDAGDDGDYWTPPSGEEFDIQKIMLMGVDIYDIVCQINNFEQIIIDKITE